MTLEQEVLEVVREIPGSDTKSVEALLSHRPPSTVRNKLKSLTLRGELVRKPKASPTRGRNTFTYMISEAPTPIAVKPKQKAPTVAGLEARLGQAWRELEELKEWKADAIRRFPELGVPQVVLRARKIVAKQFGSDKKHVDEILRGDNDNCKMMLAVLEALGEAA